MKSGANFGFIFFNFGLILCCSQQQGSGSHLPPRHEQGRGRFRPHLIKQADMGQFLKEILPPIYIYTHTYVHINIKTYTQINKSFGLGRSLIFWLVMNRATESKPKSIKPERQVQAKSADLWRSAARGGPGKGLCPAAGTAAPREGHRRRGDGGDGPHPDTLSKAR